MNLTPNRLRWILNLWPPFLFTGIRVLHIAQDWSGAKVKLKLTPFNRNAVGAHFGGSLFAMTDPFWMLLAMRQLGRDYIVWDKAGEIEFVSPGRSDVFCDFHLPISEIEAMRAETADGQKHLRWFESQVVDGQGKLVAKVRKQLYVRRKRDAVASKSS
jgi:acyl-coenzyme A thioesterase PaaI-like protein